MKFIFLELFGEQSGNQQESSVVRKTEGGSPVQQFPVLLSLSFLDFEMGLFPYHRGTW